MSFRVNTNVTAMSAYRNLSQTGMEVGRSITRLSTGLRINSGADDPAGLIASESFRAQISGMDAALRNNQDAVNYSKTADAALDEVSRLLRDARALTVANGNSTASAAQKQANQTQLNNILSSIDRIASTTTFGQKKLLDGSAGAFGSINSAANIVGVNVSGTIGGVSMAADGDLDVAVTQVAERAQVTGTAAYTAGTTLVGAGSFSINGNVFTTTATTTRDQLVAMVNERQGATGVTASVNGSNNIVLRTDAFGTGAKINLTTTAGQINTAAGSVSDTGQDAEATVTYNFGTSTATATFAGGKGLTLADAEGNTIQLTVAGNTVGTVAAAVQISAGESAFQIGANSNQTARLNIGNFSSGSLGLGGLNIMGSDMATALSLLDSAINNVSSGRANIGSFMRNTLESNIRSLTVSKESLLSTESTIRDIDVAQEMTNFTKLQILQQSGLAMLAQANSAPQAVLSLLRG